MNAEGVLYDERLAPPRGWRTVVTVVPAAVLVTGYVINNPFLTVIGILLLLVGLIGAWLGTRARITVTNELITFNSFKVQPERIMEAAYLDKPHLRQETSRSLFIPIKRQLHVFKYAPYYLKEGVIIRLATDPDHPIHRMIVGSRHAADLKRLDPARPAREIWLCSNALTTSRACLSAKDEFVATTVDRIHGTRNDSRRPRDEVTARVAVVP